MSKRAAYQYGIDRSGIKQWASLEEYAGTPEFQASVEREFPEGASELKDPVSRRSFIGLMGASLGLAGLAGCRRPEEKILPYAKRPEDMIPGEPMYFASAFPFAGSAIGVVVESHEGRPTKIEGNPAHPDSLGSANHFAQGSVLELYDPDRSRKPLMRFQDRDWADAAALLANQGAQAEKKQGEGLWILTEAHRSPTLAAQLKALTARMPKAQVVRYDPLTNDNELEGARLVFNQQLQPVPDLGRAKIIVSLDSDFLFSDGSPVKNARGFANGRRVSGTDVAKMSRLYVAEAGFSVTGSNADHRLRIANADVVPLAFALARALAAKKVDLGNGVADQLKITGDLGKGADDWVNAVADDLLRHQGDGVLVLAGRRQPAIVHAIAQLINLGLGQRDRTVRYVIPFDESPSGPRSMLRLAQAMNAGQVETLLILGGNPAYDAPADATFADALAKVPVSIHLSNLVDETSVRTTWHLNRAHYLEQWGDVRAEDGTASVIQPLIAPMFDGRTDAEVVELLTGGRRRAYELVRATWQAQVPGGSFESAWRQWLNDGVIVGSGFASQSGQANPTAFGQGVGNYQAPKKAGYEIIFAPDPHRWDGRFANVGWLNEMPDPMTKISWDNAALISPKIAKTLGIGLLPKTFGDAEKESTTVLQYDDQLADTIELTLPDGTKVVAGAYIMPSQADDTIVLSLGWGRTNAGIVGSGKGFDANVLRKSNDFWSATGVTATKTGKQVRLARTQQHQAMEGRPLVRQATVAEYTRNPHFADEMVEVPELVKLNKFNLFSNADAPKYDGQKWGMVIDLGTCIGCNACMIACQSENNIPIVGKEGVLFGRYMHWIRIDRYFTGEPEDARAVFEPIPCMQCENAPCELVCPVAATQHSPEGINEMVYNRCVGTRYCLNNCPYKVRRFNFFNYNRDVPELRRMQFNPDVTVRYRGVMEKCTYCIQRIQEAKIAARREQRNEVRDGEVITACAQTCPTNAIVFGDLNDKNSLVSKANAEPRMYRLLEELNTNPRTRFLARVTNPNPALEGA